VLGVVVFNISIFLFLWWCFVLQLITDVNLAVSVEATQAIGNLARGLRAHFSGNARMLLSVLLVRTTILFLE
jgi:hypothetical protein